LAEQYPHVYLDEWIVMPDHTHAIIVIKDDRRSGTAFDGSSVTYPSVADADAADSNEICLGGSRTAQTGTALTGSVCSPSNSGIVPMRRKPLGRLVGALKTVSIRRVNYIRSTPGATLWQRNYYEHVIRNSLSLRALRRYVAKNPVLWEL
jgi:putative transposase